MSSRRRGLGAVISSPTLRIAMALGVTLVPGDCVLTTDGFDVRIVSLEGVAQPLTLADASLDGGTFVFGDDALDPGRLSGTLADEETVLPAGYTGYVVTGGGVALSEFGYWAFENPPDAPETSLAIYNLAPASEGTDADGGAGSDATGTDATATGRTVVEVDIEDGRGTITFDLDGDGTIEFTITVGRNKDE